MKLNYFLTIIMQKRKKCKEIINKFIIDFPNKWVHPYELVNYGLNRFDSLFLQATYHREFFSMCEEGKLQKKRDENGYIVFRKREGRCFGEFEEIDDL